MAALCFTGQSQRDCASPLLELASVLVRFDHVSSIIVNANHSIMSPAVKHRVPLASADSPYHSRPNGSASEIRLTPQ
jgi:hypothetical protein